MFTATYPIGSDHTPELYTVYSDGSGVESYRCDHGNPRYAGKQLASGDIVFTSGLRLSHFTSARAQQVPISTPDGEYAGDIIETPTGEWLLPWRADKKSTFELKRWRQAAPPEDQKFLPLVSETGANVLQPVLITDHTVPKRHPSALHDWNYANLLCLNAYTSKYAFAAGEIRSMRLYTRNSSGGDQLLGSAAVERDGSFFIQVPTERPLQIELLDASGRTLKRQKGWFWMRRGEQRVCVGCHAGPETAPENGVPMVLLKSTTPTDMTGASPNDRSAASGGH